MYIIPSFQFFVSTLIFYTWGWLVWFGLALNPENYSEASQGVSFDFKKVEPKTLSLKKT